MEHQLNQQQNNVAFVLGNGSSRSKLKLPQLKKYATVFACNAIYREFNPDYLIAVDTKMVNEIVASKYHESNPVWTNPNRSIKDIPRLNFFDPHKGWSSGPTALWLASQQKFKEIYIFGFDYQGIDGKFNNVYADTQNYKKSHEPATYYGNWLSQTVTTIKGHNDINYFRIIDEGNFIPDRMKSVENLQHIVYSDFAKIFPDCI